jgi:hypothetical protein
MKVIEHAKQQITRNARVALLTSLVWLAIFAAIEFLDIHQCETRAFIATPTELVSAPALIRLQELDGWEFYQRRDLAGGNARLIFKRCQPLSLNDWLFGKERPR